MSGCHPVPTRSAARRGRGCRTACPGQHCSIHARVAGTEPTTWEDPSLVQLWGPRFSVFVVAARDLAVFSLGVLPDDAKGRQRAEDLAAKLPGVLNGRRMPYGEVGPALGKHHFSIRYAAA